MTAAAPEVPALDNTALPNPAPAQVEVVETVLADVLVEEISIDGMCGVY
jgi:mycofactocin precursor